MAEKTPEQLSIERRQWKAAVSRHINTLRRHIAEEDAKAVEERLDKLKQSFGSLESAHEAYHALLETEEDVGASDNYFYEIENNYTAAFKDAKTFLKSVTRTEVKEDSVKVVKNESAPVNMLSPDFMNVMYAPKPEFEKFCGDPLKYHVFISVFEESVKGLSDNKAKLNRLIASTTLKARDAIESFALLADGNQAYDEARKTLLERFGSDNLVCERLIRNIRNGKPVRTPFELQELSDELCRCQLILKQMNKLCELES